MLDVNYCYYDRKKSKILHNGRHQALGYQLPNFFETHL